MNSSSIPAMNLAGCRELQFLSREESNFPHLQRLVLDFKLRVLECLAQSPDLSKRYLLAGDHFTTGSDSITPTFYSLKELNTYVGEHMVDILHDYLFGVDETAADESSLQRQTYA